MLSLLAVHLLKCKQLGCTRDHTTKSAHETAHDTAHGAASAHKKQFTTDIGNVQVMPKLTKKFLKCVLVVNLLVALDT